jgi:molybdate transport system ATP-binding protein
MTEGLSADFVRRFPTGPEIRVETLRIPAQAGVTILLGPSGAGKTTVLRCLAGAEKPDEGTICFDEETWSDSRTRQFVPSRKRGVGLVPQDYALFPHLSVAGNLAYGLRDLSRGERRERLGEALTRFQLEGLERRLPAQLSGGEQQRVALARACVRRPRLLLMDEPLAAVDAPLRSRLRLELGRLLRESRLPTILVTHDRTEALALGEEIVVMDCGRIAQRGSLQHVFNRPANLAVAGIVGVETVQPARVVAAESGLVTVQAGSATLIALAPDLPDGTRDVYACIRAEDVILVRGEPGGASARNTLAAIVRAVHPEGAMLRVQLDCGFELTALLTPQACSELHVREAEKLFALLKAPQVHLVAQRV